jgi:putative aldouronate transport system substrate-binding protein
MADVINAPVGSRSLNIQAIQDGLFWDVEPFIPEYPMLNKYITGLFLEQSRLAGQMVGLPKERAPGRTCFMYRQDWAEKLGFPEPPETIDELYRMLKAFTTKDVYGLLIDKNSIIYHFPVIFGAPYKWAFVNGKATRDVDTPEYMEGLKFAKRLYDEGIIFPDFTSLGRNELFNVFADGKGGMMRDTSQSIATLQSRAREKDPDAKVNAVSFFDHPAGKRIPGTVISHNGWCAFPKSNVKNEEQLKGILAFFEATGSTTFGNLFIYGMENSHYKVENGVINIFDDKIKDYVDAVRYPYKQSFGVFQYEKFAAPAILSDVLQLEQNINVAGENFVIGDETLPYVSETMLSTNIETILTDAAEKFILGQINEAGFYAEVEKWRANGGAKIAAEFEAEYAKSKK